MKHYLSAPIGFYVLNLKGFNDGYEPVLEKYPVIAWIISHGEVAWGAEKTCSVTLSGIFENATKPILTPNGEVVDAAVTYSSLNDWISRHRLKWIKAGHELPPWSRNRA